MTKNRDLLDGFCDFSKKDIEKRQGNITSARLTESSTTPSAFPSIPSLYINIERNEKYKYFINL